MLWQSCFYGFSHIYWEAFIQICLEKILSILLSCCCERQPFLRMNQRARNLGHINSQVDNLLRHLRPRFLSTVLSCEVTAVADKAPPCLTGWFPSLLLLLGSALHACNFNYHVIIRASHIISPLQTPRWSPEQQWPKADWTLICGHPSGIQVEVIISSILFAQMLSQKLSCQPWFLWIIHSLYQINHQVLVSFLTTSESGPFSSSLPALHFKVVIFSHPDFCRTQLTALAASGVIGDLETWATS